MPEACPLSTILPPALCGGFREPPSRASEFSLIALGVQVALVHGARLPQGFQALSWAPLSQEAQSRLPSSRALLSIDLRVSTSQH